MTALEYGPLAVLAVLAALIVIGLLPASPADELRAFRTNCRAQGLDFAETEAAIAIRIAFVRLRSMASDFCRGKGSITRAEINQLAGHLAIGIAASHGENAAKSFIGWIDTCPDEEILYDDARKLRHKNAVDELRKHSPYPPTIPMDEHFKAAFKIVR